MAHPALGAMERLEAERALGPAAEAFDRVTDRLLGRGRTRRLFEGLAGTHLPRSPHRLRRRSLDGGHVPGCLRTAGLERFGPPAPRLRFGRHPLAHRQAWPTGSRRTTRGPGASGWSRTDRLGRNRFLCRFVPGSRRGDQTWAKTLSLAGGVIAFADGYLGGHLSHVRAVAVGEQVCRRRARCSRHGGRPPAQCPVGGRRPSAHPSRGAAPPHRDRAFPPRRRVPRAHGANG